MDSSVSSLDDLLMQQMCLDFEGITVNYGIIIKHIWLVVWNIFSIIYGMSSFPLAFIFFKMVKTTNQIWILVTKLSKQCDLTIPIPIKIPRHGAYEAKMQ